MRRRPQEKKEQWLLIKADDEFARPAGAAEVTLEETTSSVTVFPMRLSKPSRPG